MNCPLSSATQGSSVEALASIDPVTYAANARGRRILLLNADRDEVIPAALHRCALATLSASRRFIWYSGGHYSVIRHLFSALDRVANFFAAVDGLGVPQPIYRAAEPVTIDGRLDEPCWQDARPVPVNRQLGRSGGASNLRR